MATQEANTKGVATETDAGGPVDGQGRNQSEYEDPGNSHSDTDNDVFKSEEERTDFSDDDDNEEDAGNVSEPELSLFVSPSPTLAAEGAEAGAETRGSPKQAAEKKKRSPRTAGLSPEGKKKFKKRFSIPKGTLFDTPAAKHAEYEKAMQHQYKRKEPKGSRRIGIVCRAPCTKHFMIYDWGEARRHYKKDQEGNFKHPGLPFDNNQFKTMSKSNAAKRAKRVQKKETPYDHSSESESDVHDSDYLRFNSIPGRPGVVPEKIIKNRKSKKGTGDAPADGNAKEGKDSGKKEAKGGKSSDAKQDRIEHEMLQEDLREAHDEIATLVAIIMADRQQRSQEIIALCNAGVLNEQYAAEMIQRNPSIEDDARFADLRWTALAVSGVLADAQEHDGGPDESRGLFDFQTAEPISNSSTAALKIGRLDISQPTPVLNDQMPPDPPTQPWGIDPSLEPHNGPLTSQHRMPPASAMSNIISALQGALRGRGIELSNEGAIQILDQTAWVEARFNQLLYDAEEGHWTPPAESTGGTAEDEETEGN